MWKLSNKVILVLCLLEKSSFTLSKLRFFGLREPKNPSCYTTSIKKRGCPTDLLDNLLLLCSKICSTEGIYAEKWKIYALIYRGSS